MMHEEEGPVETGQDLGRDFLSAQSLQSRFSPRGQAEDVGGEVEGDFNQL